MAANYLIAGASAAGMAAAHTLRRLDPKGAVTVISKEACPPYFRPMIPYLVTGRRAADQIGLSGTGIFVEKGIDLFLDDPLLAVDTEAKTVTTRSGKAFSYDKLLFATGSRPVWPDRVQNLDTPGVFALKTLEDALTMAQRASQTDHAVLLGGGILNLKAAFALLEKKIRVTLVVFSPQVLSQLMDPEDATLVREALDQAGLDIITGCSATEVLAGRNGVSGVRLDNGREIPCQMVCIGKGVVPNTGFLKGSGVALDSGIITDPFTAASAKDTFAAGDVAVALNPATGKKTVTALWTHAVEMGICAGKNMAGQRTAYSGTLGIMNATQVAGLPFVAMGEVHTLGKDLEVVRKKGQGTLRKLVFDAKGQRLVGAVFIGDISRAGIFGCLIREKTPITPFKERLIDQSLHAGHLMAH